MLTELFQSQSTTTFFRLQRSKCTSLERARIEESGPGSIEVSLQKNKELQSMQVQNPKVSPIRLVHLCGLVGLVPQLSALYSKFDMCFEMNVTATRYV